MASGAATAGASEWSHRQLAADSSDRLPLFGIDCVTAQLCVTVGGGNTVGSSTNPTGDASAWKVVYAGIGPYPGSPNQRQIRGVDCPSAQLCVAVTFEGLIYTSTNPTGDAPAWQVTDVDGEGPNTHFYGVSCPSANFCAASAGEAKVLTSTNPTGGPGAWTTTQLPGPMELRGISCASAALCVAVGDDGDNIRPEIGDQAVIASSGNPLGGEWSVAPLPGRQSAYGVACPSAQLCVSGDTLGNLLVAANPTGGSGAWREIDGGGSVQITDVDCASLSLCLATDNNGDVLTSTDPDGGPGDWTFKNIVPFPFVDETQLNAFWGASCPSRSFCAISAMAGTVFTSANPFEVSALVPTAKPGKKTKKNKKLVKRPRVQIASGPPPGVETKARKVTVHFRFFARNHAFVRGYLCKLDKRSFKRCHSPKPYRVGLGRHVFRVRAIGYSGLRGRVETRRFKVCRPTEFGNCMRHLPSPNGR
ncbi:MAG: hypothetical protein ACJ76B_05230 [Solirubrobacterales bacterium]